MSNEKTRVKSEEWKMVKLGSLTNIKTGKLDANASSPDGEYPFFTCSKEPLRIDTYSYECECVLVAGNGDLNVKYYKGKFDVYQRTYIVESSDKDILNTIYLYQFLDSYLEILRNQSIGGVIKYIKLGNLTDAKIPLPALEIQMQIADELDKITGLIEKRKDQLNKLDLLIKSRFIEMFDNDENWKIEKIENLSVKSKRSMRTGPFGSSLLHSEFTDEGIFVLGIDNAVQNTFKYDKMRYISEEKYQELKNYTVFGHDVIITIMGTVGRTAVVPSDIPLAINTKHLACITFDKTIANPHFMAYALREHPQILQQLKNSKKGAIMDGLNLTLIKALHLPLPPIHLQNQFADFVKQVDKSKFEIEQSLEKLETLKKALMQEYFG